MTHFILIFYTRNWEMTYNTVEVALNLQLTSDSSIVLVTNS